MQTATPSTLYLESCLRIIATLHQLPITLYLVSGLLLHQVPGPPQAQIRLHRRPGDSCSDPGNFNCPPSQSSLLCALPPSLLDPPPPSCQGVQHAVPELLDGEVERSGEALEAMDKWRLQLAEFQESLGQNEVRNY